MLTQLYTQLTHRAEDKYHFVAHDCLCFGFQWFSIVIDLKFSDAAHVDMAQIEDDLIEKFTGDITLSDLPQDVQNILEVDNIYLTHWEYLGRRGGAGQFLKSTQFSISHIMFQCLRELSQRWPSIIDRFALDINYGYGDTRGNYQDGAPNYISLIYLRPEADTILKIVDHLNKRQLSKIYPDHTYQTHTTTESYAPRNIHILGTKTKVRRLGYYLAMAQYLAKNPKVPTSQIDRAFERHCSSYSAQLQNYQNPKGVIEVTQSGVSARPYISLYKDSHWVTELSRIIIPGKQLVVLNKLRQYYSRAGDNIFTLDCLDKAILLEVLLQNDYLFLTTLIEELYRHDESCNYNVLLKTFQTRIISKLQSEKEKQESGTVYARNLNKVTKRIKEWKKPDKYLEHIIMPRLNWLLDLSLVQFSGQSNTHYSLSSRGTSLLEQLCFWTDLNIGFLVDSTQFIRSYFVHLFNETYKLGYKHPNDGGLPAKVREYLQDCFSSFGTLAPNRITSSQAFTYIKWRLFYSDQLVVETSELELILRTQLKHDYVYKFQNQYGDGYIQKI